MLTLWTGWQWWYTLAELIFPKPPKATPQTLRSIENVFKNRTTESWITPLCHLTFPVVAIWRRHLCYPTSSASRWQRREKAWRCVPHYTTVLRSAGQISSQNLSWHTMKCGSMDSLSVNSVRTRNTARAPPPGTGQHNTQHSRLLIIYSDYRSVISQNIFETNHFSFYSSTFITLWKIKKYL